MNNEMIEKSIKALTEYSKQHGFPTVREWEKYAKEKGYFSIGQLIRLFQGKFNNAKLAAGLPVFISEDKFSNDDIVKAIKACSVYYNHRKFSEAEYMEWREQEKVNRPHIETIRKRLGFLPEVKTMLNMDTYEIHAVTNPELTKEYCLSVVRKFISEMLSNENYVKWAKENNMPAYSTILSKTKMTWEELKRLR